MECQHPELAASTSYQRGCRCVRCSTFKSDYNKEYKKRRGPEYLAQRRLYQSRIDAEKGNYAPLNATPEQVWEWMQRDTCACCRCSLPDLSGRCIHHCHETGEFIDVLCSFCNRIEGFLGQLNEAALEYFNITTKRN